MNPELQDELDKRMADRDMPNLSAELRGQQAQLAEAAANLISHMSSNAAASATPPIMHGFGSPPLQPPPQSFNTPLNAPPAFPDHDNISSQMAQIPYSSFSSDRFVGGPFGNGGRSIATPMKIDSLHTVGDDVSILDL